MLHLPTSALLLTVIFFSSNVIASSGSNHIARAHHRSLVNRHVPLEQPAKRMLRRRKTCRVSSSSSAAPSASAAATATKTTSTETVGSTKAATAPNTPGKKPADWPTETQAGPVPTSTRTSTSDPYLAELSKAIDNSGNPLYTKVHTGDMTYYGQGLGACGDYYDDDSFTAAVSMIMFDAWPGSTGEQNRNPICGPYVPGRQILDMSGQFKTKVSSSAGFAQIGGDGLLNCVGASVNPVQCHVPLTATVKHGGKSIQVKIVDRCVGCKEGDIDLTPSAFAALADMSLGRTSVEWSFDQY
ncbi:hypothetical protein C8J56DRAFT_935199 [Mycena floridula]|nr:hypothetical protein C8J56DRAFT_935199 [Mycena floridula]